MFSISTTTVLVSNVTHRVPMDAADRQIQIVLEAAEICTT